MREGEWKTKSKMVKGWIQDLGGDLICLIVELVRLGRCVGYLTIDSISMKKR